MATLYRLSEDGSKAERWELGEQPIVVGRNGHAQVSIEDEGLSRRHFLIVREGEDYILKDLNSRNGTWVDGRRVLAEKLHHNYRIQAGRTQFIFAELPVETATVCKLMTGPHGTIIVPPAPRLDRRPSASIVWQESAGSNNLEAAA
jgi:pSer/pThr/pTyr-binding forkhead associated (FHA) protein